MSKKILFVDDEPINLILIEEFLATRISLVTALTGNEALEILDKNSDDFFMVVSDLKMPEMNGFELLNKVKQQFPLIRRLLLTAYYENEEITKQLSNGLIEKVYQKTGEMDEFADDFIKYAFK